MKVIIQHIKICHTSILINIVNKTTNLDRHFLLSQKESLSNVLLLTVNLFWKAAHFQPLEMAHLLLGMFHALSASSRRLDDLMSISAFGDAERFHHLSFLSWTMHPAAAMPVENNPKDNYN